MKANLDIAYLEAFGESTSKPARAGEWTYKTFQVRCDGYRCVAYRDQHGKWRGVYDNRELGPVKDIVGPLD